MNITINRLIILKDKSFDSRYVTKTFTSAVIPHEGDFINSTAFEKDEEVEVSSVVIDYEQNECMVYLEALYLESDKKEHLKNMVDMYMLHNWKCKQQ